MHTHKKWRYKNTAFLILALIILLIIAPSGAFQKVVTSVASLGYLGAFIAGLFFVYIFSVAPATVVLLLLAQNHNLFLLSFFAALGSLLGDYIIFQIFRTRIAEEWAPALRELKGSHVYKVFHSPYFSWTLPVLTAVLIASPIPDEIAVGALGFSKLKDWQFIPMALVLDYLGILVLVFLGTVV